MVGGRSIGILLGFVISDIVLVKIFNNRAIFPVTAKNVLQFVPQIEPKLVYLVSLQC